MTGGVAAIEGLCGQVRDRGWCVLEGVIPDDRIGAVRDAVLAVEPAHNRADAPAKRGAVSGLINHTQAFAPYLVEPRLRAVTRALLGEHLRVSFTSTIVSQPGAERLQWHADWPFNQTNAGHLAAPYPATADALLHLTSIWMLTDFTIDNGATLVVPGSHRQPNNPTGDNGVPLFEPHPEERHLTGRAGSVAILDSRLWHAAPRNASGGSRVGLAVRWAPWWLNLDVLMPGSDERARMVEEVPGAKDNEVPAVDPQVFARLPAEVRPLFRHWVRGGGNWRQ